MLLSNKGERNDSDCECAAKGGIAVLLEASKLLSFAA